MGKAVLSCECGEVRASIDVITAEERGDGGPDKLVLRIGDERVEATFYVDDDQLVRLSSLIHVYLMRSASGTI
jgi:hypothetical protein